METQQIPDQIRLERKQPGTDGCIIYNATSLLTNSPRSAALQHTLQTTLNAQPALVPASPWLGSNALATPNLTVADIANGVRLDWNGGTNSASIRWCRLCKRNLSADEENRKFAQGDPSRKASTGTVQTPSQVQPIDRVGNASPARVLEMKKLGADPRILLRNSQPGVPLAGLLSSALILIVSLTPPAHPPLWIIPKARISALC